MFEITSVSCSFELSDKNTTVTRIMVEYAQLSQLEKIKSHTDMLMLLAIYKKTNKKLHRRQPDGKKVIMIFCSVQTDRINKTKSQKITVGRNNGH